MLSIVRTRHELVPTPELDPTIFGKDVCGVQDLPKPWPSAKVQYIELEGNWAYVYWIDAKYTRSRDTRIENIGFDH